MLNMFSVDIERILILPLLLISMICIGIVVLLKKNVFIFNIEREQGKYRFPLYCSIMLWLSYIWLFSAYIFMGLASAGISLVHTDNELVQREKKILFLIDVSPSMSVEDISDVSRWEAVRVSMHALLDDAYNETIGIVFFSNSISFSVPFTNDYDYIKTTLDTIHLGTLGHDTALSDALAFAYQVYEQSKEKSNTDGKGDMSIVIITDGNQNTGAISLSEVQPFLKTIASRISFINIGKNEPAHFTYNDRETLQIISGTLLPVKNNFIADYIKNIGIQYYPIENKKTLFSLLTHIITDKSDSKYFVSNNIKEDKTNNMLVLAMISIMCFSIIRTVFLRGDVI